MKNWHIIACMLCSVLLVGTGCSSDSRDSNNDLADVEHSDVEHSDVGHSDADQEDSGQVDANDDVSPGTDTATDTGDEGNADVDSDTGDESDADVDSDTGVVDEEDDKLPVTIESGGKQFPFSRAAYGITGPEKSEDGIWELHVELWEGGFSGCPTATSPTPYRQLVFYGLSVDDTDELVVDDWLALLLLDFRGEVFPEESEKPVVRPYALKATPKSWEFCTACLTGEGDADKKNGELVVKLEAEYDNGTLKGTLRAKHCESMDLL